MPKLLCGSLPPRRSSGTHRQPLELGVPQPSSSLAASTLGANPRKRGLCLQAQRDALTWVQEVVVPQVQDLDVAVELQQVAELSRVLQPVQLVIGQVQLPQVHVHLQSRGWKDGDPAPHPHAATARRKALAHGLRATHGLGSVPATPLQALPPVQAWSDAAEHGRKPPAALPRHSGSRASPFPPSHPQRGAAAAGAGMRGLPAASAIHAGHAPSPARCHFPAKPT